uniref:Tudor domain-containing protein n=1 Tax=Lutzomyia longipalpis TaxID=7200 RepID=A0A1B0CHS2_LUTLO
MAITCHFNEVHSGVYHVNVTVERGDFLEALIKDGLVKVPKEKEAPAVLAENIIVNVSLLHGQTIRVRMANVESLEKFQVNFEHSDIHLPATYYDINCGQILIKKMGEQLKKLEGTYCKVYILSRVFLEEPPLICPQAIFQSSFSAIVPFVESLNVVYVQKIEFSELLTQQIDEMFSYYESEDSHSYLRFDVALKGIYAVKSPSDANWYRGEVLTINGDEITVKYIDYGNKEVVKVENLRFLTAQFSQASSYATRVFLMAEPMDPDGAEKATEALSELILNILPSIHFLKDYRGEWIVELSANGCNVVDELERKGLARPTDMGNVFAMIDKRDDLREPQGQVEGISAYMTHISHPNSFYLQHNADLDAIEALQASIQCVATSLPKVTQPEVGQLCLGLFSIDEQWYRARILDTDGDVTSVQYIDYGNTDVITNAEHLREISDAFEGIPAYARRCSLPLTPKGAAHQDDWAGEVVEIMQKIFQDQSVRYTEISESDGLMFVHLYTEEGTSAEEIFLKKSLAEPLSIIEAHSIGFVSHINSIGDFYIQLEKDADDLYAISDALIVVGAGGGDVREPEEGKMYAALFPDDNLWYRAKLVHSVAQQLEVIFVDYGNTAITNAIKELPEKIAAMPILSKKCSLEAPQGGKKWSEEAEKKFTELAQDGATSFEIIPLALGETTRVRLLHEGRNVVEMLQEGENSVIDLTDYTEASQEKIEGNLMEEDPKNEEVPAKITVANTPGDFYIHLTSDDARLQQLLEHLENPQLTAVSGREISTLCAAKYSEDGCYYRAKIEAPEDDEKFRVFFIDYGNTSVTSDLFELSQEMQAIEPLAVHCALAGKAPSEWTEGEKEGFLRILKEVNCDEQIFQIVFVNRTTTPALVKLFLNGQEINLKEEEQEEQPVVNGAAASMTSEDSVEQSAATEESRKLLEDIVDNGIVAHEILDGIVENGMIAKEIIESSLTQATLDSASDESIPELNKSESIIEQSSQSLPSKVSSSAQSEGIYTNGVKD